MKNENIPADIKSKSLKEARDEINEILNKLEGKDFILGVDQISHKLTLEKIGLCRKRAERFYSKRKKANRDMQKDVRLNEKRIRNININIDILVDQIFLYQSRVNQFNKKYNE